jgi:hypothetical protein
VRIGITEGGDAGLDFRWVDRAKLVDGAILITKHPHKFTTLLGGPKWDLPDNAILHCTITGQGHTELEPGISEPETELMAYDWLVQEYGPERIVLRVDPIVPWMPWLDNALKVLTKAKGRVRISFLDMYPHVRARFEAENISIPEQAYRNGIHTPIRSRMMLYDTIKKRIPDIEICGEPGMECTGCVSLRDLKALGITGDSNGYGAQRPACACLVEKTELLGERKPCMGGKSCLYCYWKS